ncbi:MAG: DUF4956 domain-containing protein [Clostridia bacterium]
MSLDSLFTGIFDSTSTTVISVSDFILCIASALIVGVIIALSYTFKSKYTRSFVTTLAILPAGVAMVIMMVNGNVGTGVAVAGAFSLVRFRSAPGTAKEIGAIFTAVGSGLAIGMGYIAIAYVFAIMIIAFNIIVALTNFGEKKATQRIFTITMPEDLNYTRVFDDLFKKYTKNTELINVKTTNMGSLFKLRYEIDLIDEHKEKEFIDQIRCRNGNLEITVSKQSNAGLEL